MNRPHTTTILAITADGKIADYTRSAARFGSATDKAHLESQISLVDGVIFGAGTLRAYGTSLPISNTKLRQSRQDRGSIQPIHLVVSASGEIDSGLKFFQQPIPRWLLTTKDNSQLWQNNNLFDRIIDGKTNSQSSFEWNQILPQLFNLGMQKLAILGGGELVASLLAVKAIDEIWLTVCPVIFGGVTAPTPVGGKGWLQSEGIKLDLLEVKQIDREVFLHYRVIY
jgi:5-amino-6-(5-phosphoribosylamino)uracil reductase